MKMGQNVIKVLKLVLIVATFALIIIIFIKQKRIDELNARLDVLTAKIDQTMEELDTQLTNQSTLFYKTIGETLPVVVPEKSKEELNELLTLLHDMSANLTEEKLTESVDRYMKYIKNTPPWIQEATAEDVLYAKYTIDYYTILNNFNKNNDINDLVDSMQSFILTSRDYKDINQVVKAYNSFVDKQNELHKQQVNELNVSMEKAFANHSITHDELTKLLDSVVPYTEEESLQTNIKKLGDYLSESDQINQLKEELNKLNDQLDSIEDNIYQEATYNVYAEQLAMYNYRTHNIKLLDNKILLDTINNCAKKLAHYNQNLKKKYEQDIANEIQEGLNKLNAQLNAVEDNDDHEFKYNLYAEQLAMYNYRAHNIELLDNKTLLATIASCTKKLNDYNQYSKKKQELEVLNEISNSIQVCKTEVDNLVATTTSYSMISILATQLATLEFNARSLPLVDTSMALKDIQSCMNLLNSKEAIIANQISNKDKNDIKTYNRRALNVIEHVKHENDKIGFFTGDKNGKRVELLEKLETIQAGYLYPAIGTLYQQIYQEIWNNLDSDGRFTVSKRALNITKKELKDEF